MEPLLSIVITNYNYTHLLSKLFDNIMDQDIKDIEIVVVDDCSDTPCNKIINDYSDKGLNVILFQNKVRQYTKDSRLNGIEAANGKLITFIDADDLFHGTKALKYHVGEQLRTDADIVHFSMLSYTHEDDKINNQVFPWTKPFGEYIEGKDVFNTYVRSNLNGHNICGKIIKKELWMKCLPAARASTIRRYCEDLFLSSLTFFHAQSYLGSTRIGYSREWIDKAQQKALGRAVTHYTLLAEFVPYVESNGVDKDILPLLKSFFLKFNHKYVFQFLETLQQQEQVFTESNYTNMLQHGTPEKLLRAIMTGLV